MAVLDPQSIRERCRPRVELVGLTHIRKKVRLVGLERAERYVETVPPLVSPFHERTRHRGKTFGLGPAGYDVRIAETLWLWPFWGRLASTIERFDIPADLTFLVQDKSSWARLFVFAMNTNGEPGWRGTLTLELVRFLPWPIKIHAGDPISNIMFLELRRPSSDPYRGKYQDQEPGPQKSRYDKWTTAHDLSTMGFLMGVGGSFTTSCPGGESTTSTTSSTPVRHLARPWNFWRRLRSRA